MVGRIVLGTGALMLTLGSIAWAGDSAFVVFPDEVGGKALDCGNGRVATGGGFSSAADSSWEMVASQPGGSRWEVKLANGSEMSQTAAVRAKCASKSRYRVVGKRVRVTGEPFLYKRVKVKCPAGMTVAGGGFGPTSISGDPAHVLESRPAGKRRWLVRTYVYDLGPSPEFVFRAKAVCDRTGADYAVRSETEDFDSARAARRGTLIPFDLRPQCRPSQQLAGGGFATNDLNVYYTDVHNAGSGYKVAGGAYGGDPVTAVVLCRK